MRILMLAPTPYFADRGCHVRIYEEARALIESGCDVCIVTYHHGRDMPGIPTFRIPSMPWYQKLTAGPSWFKPLLDILLFIKALSVSRTFRPHLLHAHLHEGAFIGLLLKLVLRLPLIMDSQGSLTVECRDHGFFRSGSFLEKLFSALENLINNSADFIITSSTVGAKLLSEKWGVPTAKLSAVIDGVDTDRFVSYPKSAARSRVGVSEDVPLVVFLGLLNEYQGMDVLLKVIQILKEQQSQIRFLIMGYPYEGYKRKASDLRLDEMVTFTGRIDYSEAALMLSAGDIAVSPKLSLTEANGKLFNYMACALPTVVFDTPVNREILGDTGVYAAFNDAVDMARQISGIIADKGLLAKMSLAVRARAVSEHSWKLRAKMLVELYRQLKE
jgi:glycosyltransferase involved in cell wall biosynthesis